MVYIKSILYTCQEKIGSMFQLFKVLIGSILGSSMEHVGAMLVACLVVHVSSLLGEVGKHIGSLLKLCLVQV